MNPYLSVVAVSRNDDHGGDPLRRTQIFIDSLAWQARHFKLPLELVIVEWNPPVDKKPLREVLKFEANEYFTSRVITVPQEIHKRFRFAGKLPLYQMIAKNVGIRRAKGEFVLATNIDIVLDDALFAELAKRRLKKNCFYRADRYDINNYIPEKSHMQQQAFCRNPENHIRRNYRLRPNGFGALQNQHSEDSQNLVSHKDDFPQFDFYEEKTVLQAGKEVELCNTNGCGDFTLMAREAWENINGYAEIQSYSLHIDSIGLYCAYCSGLHEVSFLPPLVCYHIEHAPMSGWTPENAMPIYERVISRNLPFLEFASIENSIIPKISQKDGWKMNNETWGLISCKEVCGGYPDKVCDLSIVIPEGGIIYSLKDEFDPAILNQDFIYHWRKKNSVKFEYLMRLNSHKYWKFLEMQIKLYRRLKRMFSRKN